MCRKYRIPYRLLLATLLAAGGLRPMAAAAEPARGLTEEQRIVHVLNRLAFGPRPGDVAAVRRMRIQRWIDQQLHPEQIDDSAAQAKLARFTDLTKSAQDLMAAYMEDQQRQRQIRLARLQAAKEPGEAASGRAGGAATSGFGVTPSPPHPLTPSASLMVMPGAAMQVQQTAEAVGELDNAKVLRAVDSQRQLQEVLTDFWSNHFNVDAKKGLVRGMLVANERDAIRPHVLGKFRDLLEATAKSPAMLFYLDNAISTRDPDAPGPLGRTIPAPMRPAVARRGMGLNENYGRELMELHTLGVDGGYTQKDVQEVARCFTGWSIDRQTGTFRFYSVRHDYGEKVVLGHVIPAGGGIEDGEKVLDVLASHPSTAHFIARKLCMRFVSDDPPASLVDRAAKTFLKTGGDLREVVRTIVTSPEFFSPKAYQTKFKSPFEFAVSAVRALGGTVEPVDTELPGGHLRLVADGGTTLARNAGNRRPGPRFKPSIAQELAAMGEPLFSHEAPTGYPEDSREWLSAGALLARMNFALYLTSDRIAQVQLDPALQPTGGSTAQLADTFSDRMLGTRLSPKTRAAILAHAGTADPATVAALILGSPDFQRR